MFKVKLVAESRTRQLAHDLSAVLVPGDCLVLSGELGAGKTCFTQGLGRGLGVTETITSPTFNIINIYSGRLPLYHLDFYRLETEAELVALGVEEYMEAAGVTVVEWGDKFGGCLPREYLLLEFKRGAADNERIIWVNGLGRRGRVLAKKVRESAARLGLPGEAFGKAAEDGS